MTVNVYRDAYGREFDTIVCCAGGTVAEICGSMDWENTVIVCDGRIVDSHHRPDEDSVVCVRTFPSGGGGGKTAFSVTMSVLTGGLWAGADVITKAASGKWIEEHMEDTIKGWITPKDSANTNALDQTATIPTMKGARNQSGFGKPIPLVLGRTLLTPLYHGSPYTEIAGDDGEDQYYTCMYILGYSDIDVRDISLNNITVATNSAGTTSGYIKTDSGRAAYDSNITLEIRQGAAELETYQRKVVQEDLNIELMHPDGKDALEVDRFSAANPHEIDVELAMSSLYGYNDDGQMEEASVQVAISVSFDGGVTYSPFGRVGGSDAYTTSGTYGISTITRAKNKNMRFAATRTLTRAEALSCVDKGDGVAFIRIKRSDTQSTDSTVSDTVYLTAIRTRCFDRKKTQAASSGIVVQRPVEEQKRDITTRLAVRIKADDNLAQSLDELSMIVTSKCRTWNGSSWTAARTATANPAAVALMVMQSPMLGRNAYPDSKIDMEAFGRLYEFCENQTYTDPAGRTEKFAFTCGSVMLAQRKLSEVIDTILGTCKAMRVLNGDKYSVLIDEPRSVPVTVLNNHNLLADGLENSKSFDELPDGYRVKFVDKDNGYIDGEFYCMYDGSDHSAPGAVTETFEIAMVTDYRQAYKLARYELAKRKLRPETWTRRVGLEGAVIEIGSLVSIQDETLMVGIGDGGEIRDVILSADGKAVIAVVIDSSFPVSDLSPDYAVKISHFDVDGGRSFDVRRVVTERTGYYDTLVFRTPISLNDTAVPVIGDILSFGVYGRETTDALCFGKKQDADGTYTLTLMPYSEGVYTADTGAIPEFDSKMTSVRPIPGISSLDPDWATREEIMDVLSDLSGLIKGNSTRVTNPDNVTGLVARAKEEGISVEWDALGTGISNTVKCFELQVSKDGGASWTTYTPTKNSYEYVFDRSTDGYPEAEDLLGWRFRCRARNIYDLTSKDWSKAISVDVGGYLSWIPGKITGCTAVAVRDYIDLSWQCDNSGTYGSVRYRIRRAGAAVRDGEPRTGYAYYFDRMRGEYPEKTDLGKDAWKWTVEAYNESGRSTSADASYDLSGYLTWLPAVPVAGFTSSGRTVMLDVREDGSYWGWHRYELQISMDNKEWWSAYGGSADVHTDETLWRGAKDGITALYGSLYNQELPLRGQAGVTGPQATTYYYRLRAVTRTRDTSGKDKDNLSAWCGTLTAVALATSASDIVNGAINSARLESGSVTIEKIEDGAVTEKKLGPGAVTIEKIADGAVTADKIAANAVTAAKITAGAVTADKIAANAVEADKIASNAVTAAKIAANAVTAAKIAAGAVTAEKIAADTVTARKLNVIATNLVNPITNDTPGAAAADRWTGLKPVKDSVTGLVIGERTSNSTNIKSADFEVLPDAIYEVKFGIETSGWSSGSGLFIGLTLNQSFKSYKWDAAKGQWFYSATSSNAYFLSNYTANSRRYYTTYILGANVQTGTGTSTTVAAQGIPAPSMTDGTYNIYALQLTGSSTTACVRSGNNAISGSPVWRLIAPQVYERGSASITAESVYAQNLAAITVNLGDVAAGSISSAVGSDGSPDPGSSLVHLNGRAGSEEFYVGNVARSKASETDASHEFIRLYKVSGAFRFVIKITNFLVTSIQSVIKGILRVKSSLSEADADAFMTVNPTTSASSGTPARTVGVRGAVSIDTGSSAGASLTIRGLTAATATYADANPKIRFQNKDASQSMSLTYTEYDSVQAPAALVVNGNQGGEYLIAPHLKASSGLHLTGSGALYCDGSAKSLAVIRMKEGNADGHGIVIGGGGATVIGGGESAANYYTGAGLAGQSEVMVIANDQGIDFVSNMQNGYSSGKKMTYGTDGSLKVPGSVSAGSLTVSGAVSADSLALPYNIRTMRFSKSDNGGSPTLFLISDVTEWYKDTATGKGAYGICGMFFSSRQGGYMGIERAVRVTCRCQYQRATANGSCLSLLFDRGSLVVPVLVSYQSRQYLALRCTGSSHCETFIGYAYNVMSTITQLNYSGSSLPSGVTLIAEGKEYETYATTSGSSDVSTYAKRLYTSQQESVDGAIWIG